MSYCLILKSADCCDELRRCSRQIVSIYEVRQILFLCLHLSIGHLSISNRVSAVFVKLYNDKHRNRDVSHHGYTFDCDHKIDSSCQQKITNHLHRERLVEQEIIIHEALTSQPKMKFTYGARSNAVEDKCDILPLALISKLRIVTSLPLSRNM